MSQLFVHKSIFLRTNYPTDWQNTQCNIQKMKSAQISSYLSRFSVFVIRFEPFSHFLDIIFIDFTHFMFFCRVETVCTPSLQMQKNPAASNCWIFFCLCDFDVFVSSEPLRDVLHTPISQAFHHALVRGGTVQGTQFSHISA